MKTICVTGSHSPDLVLISQLLAQVGAQEALPGVRQGQEYTLHDWHASVLQKTGEVPVANDQVGRLWEQLAADILLANHQQSVWYWAAPDSTWLLDFWYAFDSDIHFLLTATSVMRVLSTVIDSDPARIEQALTDWQRYTEAMLRFHLRYWDRSMLIDPVVVLANPADWLRQVSGQWSLPLAPSAELSCECSEPNALKRYLCQQYMQDYPELLALQHELQASLSQCAEASMTDEQWQTPTITASINDYHQLYQTQQQIKQLEADKQAAKAAEKQARQAHDEARQQIEQLERTQAKLQQDTQGLTQARDEQARLAQTHQQERDQLADAKASLQREKEEAQEENELLLQQLHQVQEELEQIFLAKQEAQAALDSKQAEVDQAAKHQATLNQTIKELTQARDEALHKVQQAETELNAAKEAEKQANQARNKAQQQIKQLEADKQAAKAAEKQARQAHDEARQQIEQLERTQAKLQQDTQGLTQARDEQARLAQTHQQERDQLADAKASLQREKEEAQEENELLLQQLHQVQEELEHYFLEHQQAKEQLNVYENRWQKLLARYPDFYDYQALEVLAITEEQVGPQITWRVSQFVGSTGTLPELIVRTLRHNGQVSVIFGQTEAGTAPLLRWPAIAAGQAEVACDPSLDSADPNHAMNQLSTSDWALLKRVVTLLNDCLATATCADQIDQQQWQQALQATQNTLAAWPELLRFDRISLTQEYVDPGGYEHLWIMLDNVEYGGQTYPCFEFRVACDDIVARQFGTLPKLEFPAGEGARVFRHWFEESRNDFGAKLELRFAAPDDVDIGIWQQLAAPDRQLINQLIDDLPLYFTYLRQTNPTLKRSWEEWENAVRLMQTIVQARGLKRSKTRQQATPKTAVKPPKQRAVAAILKAPN